MSRPHLRRGHDHCARDEREERDVPRPTDLRCGGPLHSSRPGSPAIARSDAVTLLSCYALLLILIPPQLIFQPLGAVGTPANIIALGALFAWVAGRIVPYLGLALERQPVRTLIFVLAASTLASFVASASRVLPIEEVRGADRGLLHVAAWSGVALLASDGIQDRFHLDRLLQRVATLGAVLATTALLQFSLGIDVADWIKLPGFTLNYELDTVQIRYGVPRVAGTATHPIELGVVLAMILPIALHYAIYAPETRRLEGWVRCALVALGALVSVSRSAALGLAVVGIALFPAWPKERRRQVLALAPLILAVVPFVLPGVIGTFRGLFTGMSSDPSVLSRTDDYAQVGAFIRESPILGRGFGAFLPHLYTPKTSVFRGASLILDNQYLQTIIQTGIVGLAALLMLLLGAILTARSARRRSDDATTRELAQSLAAALLVPVVTFATFDGLSFGMAAGMVFLVAGCIGALWRLVVLKPNGALGEVPGGTI